MVMIKGWKKTQSTPTYEKWEIHKSKFGEDVWGEITLIKQTGYPRISYGILAKAYKTKPIGIKGTSQGLVKVLKDRHFSLKTHKGAKIKIMKLKRELTRIVKMS